jgi:hypothetical protein
MLFESGPAFPHLLDSVAAFLLRHDDIGDDEVRLLAAALRAVLGRQNLIAQGSSLSAGSNKSAEKWIGFSKDATSWSAMPTD